MDARWTPDRSSRRAAKALAGPLLVLALALSACGGSGGEGAGDGGTDCGVLTDYLMSPVRLSEADGGEPAPERLTPEEEEEVPAAISAALPPELAEPWDRVMAAAEDQAAGGSLSDEERRELVAVYEDAVVWASEACTEAPPAWRCLTQEKFERIPMETSDGGTDVEPVDDPDDLLAERDDADDAVVLDESDTAILWGWLDDDGLVVDSKQANLVDGAWIGGETMSCRDEVFGGGSGSFEPVGEPIAD